MTALRQRAFLLIQSMPEENLLEIIQYIQAKKFAEISKNEKKIALKENADEIQAAIDGIKGVLSSMSEVDKNKSIADWREERLREKYAEYFD